MTDLLPAFGDSMKGALKHSAMRLCCAVAIVICLVVPLRAEQSVLVLKEDVPQYNATLQSIEDALSETTGEFSLVVVDVDTLDTELASSYTDRTSGPILSIGTEPSVFAAQTFPDRPLIYAMVLNPGRDELLALDDERVITGVSARVDPSSLIECVVRLNVGLETIGLVYTPDYFQQYVSDLRSAAAEVEIGMVALEVESKDEFVDRFNEVLNSGIDCFVILPDFDIYEPSTIEYVLINTFRRDVPCLGPSHAVVESGALWGLSIHPPSIGRQAVGMLIRYLAGEPVPPEYSKRNVFSFNPLTAESLGVRIGIADLDGTSAILPE